MKMRPAIKSYFAPFSYAVTLITEWETNQGIKQIPRNEVDIEISSGETLRYTIMEVDKWERGEIELWAEDSMPVKYND